MFYVKNTQSGMLLVLMPENLRKNKPTTKYVRTMEEATSFKDWAAAETGRAWLPNNAKAAVVNAAGNPAHGPHAAPRYSPGAYSQAAGRAERDAPLTDDELAREEIFAAKEMASFDTAPRRPLKNGFVMADSDGQYYHNDDTKWGIHPSEDDGVGYLVPKPGAVPVSFDDCHEAAA